MSKGSMLAAVAGVCGSIGAISGKLSFDSTEMQYAKFMCIAVFIVSNIVMWAAYTRALTLSECTSTPMIVNVACNFALTGVLGSFIFSESHSYTWWLLLVVLIIGLALMLSPNQEKDEYLKED